MDEKRVSLYERLPEIYRIKDQEQQPPFQLKSYLALVEKAFGAIHENIESLYHDLFIETSSDWVIPYIGDLLGTSHLSGDPWTLRADVADTIALRRRKGTLGAIELLTYNLTQWGVHCVELRENLVWNQHLNHQRQDEGGKPPYGLPSVTRHTVIRGGTVTLRDPAMLSLLNTPFDPFAHTADLKPQAFGNIRYNLPNLAIFLWRLNAYRIGISKPLPNPLTNGIVDNSLVATGTEAKFITQFYIHPLGEPVRLFNTYRFNPDIRPPVLSQIDETPGPIPTVRLTEGSAAGVPDKYVSIDIYSATEPLNISDAGFQMYLPESPFAGNTWTLRGANLCAWETGLQPTLKNREIAIDPVIGRIVIGIDTAAEAAALVDHLLLTYTYGAVGPVGAHPISRPSAPKEWTGEPVLFREVNFHQNPHGLRDSLSNIQDSTSPIVIEIKDSMIHELNVSDPALIGTLNEDGGFNLRLNRSLIIRAADDHRPIIRLTQPLRFRPTHVKGINPDEQKQFDAIMANLTVRLEGLYITRSENWEATNLPGTPLIARAALHHLEIFDCTLDPGGSRELDGTPEGKRTPIHPSMRIREPYGFANADEEKAFNQIPEIMLHRTVTGPLFIGTGYRLFLTDSIIDAGSGVNDDPTTAVFAISGAGDPSTSWGPLSQVNGITVFGRMRVEGIHGRGGIWVHTLEVLDNQKGCMKFSYFSGNGDRLPQNHGCVKGTEAHLRFISEIFGNPAYGQLAYTTDFRIRERGPNDDAMGAFGFLMEAHKWRNIQIRYREFMPVGVRPLLIPVT